MKEFKGSHEKVNFSKLHKGPKPEKQHVSRERKGESHTGYTVGSASGEREELFLVVFMREWKVIEGMDNWGQE